jgi:hypothetical protein
MSQSGSGAGIWIAAGLVLLGAYSCFHGDDWSSFPKDNWWSASKDDQANDAAIAATAGTYRTDVGTAACTDDCSGHDAGYAWAREHDIDDEANCPTDHGDSFEGGCKAFVAAYNDAYDDALTRRTDR